MIDFKSQKFIQNAQTLCSNLDSAGKKSGINDSKYSNIIFELNNSIDFINNQKELNDDSIIQESIVKFAERFFKGLIKLLNIIKYSINGRDDEIKLKIQQEFNPFALDIINLVDEYGSLLKLYASDTKSLLSKMKNQFDKEKDEFEEEKRRKAEVIQQQEEKISNNDSTTQSQQVKDMIISAPKKSYKISTKNDNDYMNIYNNNSYYNSNNNYSNTGGFDYSLFESDQSIISNTIQKIKDVGRNIENVGNGMEDISNSAQKTYDNFKNTVDRIADFIKNPFGTRESSSSSSSSLYSSSSSNNTDNFISGAFKIMGEYISQAFIYIGNLFAEIPDVISNGANHLEHILQQYNRNGINAVLNDNESMQYISSGIYYSIKYIAIIWIARIILRKITGFLAWISGYKQNRRR